jgi:hypothetical protein
MAYNVWVWALSPTLLLVSLAEHPFVVIVGLLLLLGVFVAPLVAR